MLIKEISTDKATILYYKYIYIHIYSLFEIIQNLQIFCLKFHAINDEFQAIVKLSYNSNTLILHKV